VKVPSARPVEVVVEVVDVPPDDDRAQPGYGRDDLAKRVPGNGRVAVEAVGAAGGDRADPGVDRQPARRLSVRAHDRRRIAVEWSESGQGEAGIRLDPPGVL